MKLFDKERRRQRYLKDIERWKRDKFLDEIALRVSFILFFLCILIGFKLPVGFFLAAIYLLIGVWAYTDLEFIKEVGKEL